MSAVGRSPKGIHLVRGQPRTLPITWRSPSPPTGSGLPLDITGATLTAQMLGAGPAQPLLVDGRDDPGGRAVIHFTADQTALVTDPSTDPRMVATLTDTAGRSIYRTWPLIGDSL